MNGMINLEQLQEKISKLDELTQEIFDGSENFPAINRNCKRILASVKMLKLNVEGADIE